MATSAAQEILKHSQLKRSITGKQLFFYTLGDVLGSGIYVLIGLVGVLQALHGDDPGEWGEPNNAKFGVKLVVLLAALVLLWRNRRRDPTAGVRSNDYIATTRHGDSSSGSFL